MYVLAFFESAVQLVPDGTIVVHIALILLMIYVLNRTFYRPINKVIEMRERNKGGHSSEAEQILSKVNERNAQFENEMLGARSTGYKMIESERNQAVLAKESALGAIREEVSAKVTSEKASLLKQKEGALKTLSGEAEQLAAKIKSNILGS